MLPLLNTTKEGTPSMTDNMPINLPEIRLPRDLAWRVKFIEAVEEHVRHLGVTGHFQPPRFFGYYFAGRHPVVLARHWKVTLDAAPLLWRMHHVLEGLTDSQFSIAAKSDDTVPDYLLVHDRFDGACWLWEFARGRRFVEAHEPMQGASEPDGASGDGGAQNQKLFGS
jgi:hypothetical protein